MDNSIAYETKMNAFIEHSGLITISEPFSDNELENEKIFSESGENINMLSQSEIPNNDALIESEKLDQITSHSIPSINMYQFIRRHKTKNLKVTKVNKLYSYTQSERKILITDANNLISSVIEAASATLKNNGDKKKRKRDFFENFKLYQQETLLKKANLTAIKENENVEPLAKELAKDSKLSLPEIPGLKEEKKSKKIIEPKTVTISKATVEKEQTSNLNSISLPQISKNNSDNANINSSNSDTANLIPSLKVKKKSKNPNKEKKEKKVFLLVI